MVPPTPADIIRNPPGYPSYHMDALPRVNLRADVFTSTIDTLKFFRGIARQSADPVVSVIVRPNSYKLTDSAGKFSVSWIPLLAGYVIVDGIHYDDFTGGIRSGLQLRDRWETTVHMRWGIRFEFSPRWMIHPFDVHAYPCNTCGFPCPKTIRKRCRKCRIAVYCSVDCQHSDWEAHKVACAVCKRVGDTVVSS